MFISAVYAWLLLEATSTTVVTCIACWQPAVVDLRSKLPCVLQLHSSQLQVTDTAL